MISQICDGPQCGRTIGPQETVLKVPLQVTQPKTPWTKAEPIESVFLDFCSWTCLGEYASFRATSEGIPPARGSMGVVRTERSFTMRPVSETGELMEAEVVDVLP